MSRPRLVTIQEIVATPMSKLRFRDFANLKVGGRDRFTPLRLAELRLLVTDRHILDAALDHDETAVASCLRWMLRGLPIEKAVRKVLEKNDGAGYGVLRNVVGCLESLEPWTASAIEAELTTFCEANDLKLGGVAQPLRVALSGGTVSPAIYDTLELVGRDRTINRIKQTMMQGSEQA